MCSPPVVYSFSAWCFGAVGSCNDRDSLQLGLVVPVLKFAETTSLFPTTMPKIAVRNPELAIQKVVTDWRLLSFRCQCFVLETISTRGRRNVPSCCKFDDR